MTFYEIRLKELVDARPVIRILDHCQLDEVGEGLVYIGPDWLHEVTTFVVVALLGCVHATCHQ